MIFEIVLSIAVFQGIILGTIILRSPIFNTNANKYLAYTIFVLSILLVNLVFELLSIYDSIPLLYFIDNIEWIFTFPVFILLFIVHQVDHPIKHSRKLRWLFIPFWYSAILNIVNDFDKIAGVYSIPNAINSVVEALVETQILIILPFILGVLIYAYTFIKFAKDPQEKKWILLSWISVFTFLFSWVMAVFVLLIFNFMATSLIMFLALVATFLIHSVGYFGIYRYKLARDKEGINILLSSQGASNAKALIIDVHTKNLEDNITIESFTNDNPYYLKLETFCNHKHIYKDSTLNREKVAELLGISAGYLSQLVKEYPKKTEELKKLLEKYSEEERTIIR